jgi:hypothetical protein
MFRDQRDDYALKEGVDVMGDHPRNRNLSWAAALVLLMVASAANAQADAFSILQSNYTPVGAIANLIQDLEISLD